MSAGNTLIFHVPFHSRDVELGIGDYQQMPRLILNQFRWLDCLVDGKVHISKQHCQDSAMHASCTVVLYLSYRSCAVIFSR